MRTDVRDVELPIVKYIGSMIFVITTKLISCTHNSA